MVIKRKWRINFLLFLVGFIIFSPIQSYLFIQVLGFPLTLPEILLLPIIRFLRRQLGLRLTKEIYSYFFVGLLLVFLALLVNIFPIYSILSTFRAYLYIFIALVAVKNRKIPAGIDGLFAISLGSTFAWAVLSYISFQGMVTWGKGVAVYGNMITLGMSILIPFIFYKRVSIIVTLILSLIISIYAGLRRQIVVVALSLFFGIYIRATSSLKSFVMVVLGFCLSLPIVINIFKFAVKYIERISPILYSRVITKSVLLFDGKRSESDVSRLKNFREMRDNFYEYILPRGFVSKRTLADKELGAYMDIPVKELLHTFGLIFTVVLLVVFLSRMYYHYFNYRRNGTRESGLIFGMAIVMIALFFLEGSFLNFMYTVPVTGFILGRLLSTRNLIV